MSAAIRQASSFDIFLAAIKLKTPILNYYNPLPSYKKTVDYYGLSNVIIIGKNQIKLKVEIILFEKVFFETFKLSLIATFVWFLRYGTVLYITLVRRGNT